MLIWLCSCTYFALVSSIQLARPNRFKWLWCGPEGWPQSYFLHACNRLFRLFVGLALKHGTIGRVKKAASLHSQGLGLWFQYFRFDVVSSCPWRQTFQSKTLKDTYLPKIFLYARLWGANVPCFCKAVYVCNLILHCIFLFRRSCQFIPCHVKTFGLWILDVDLTVRYFTWFCMLLFARSGIGETLHSKIYFTVV